MLIKGLYISVFALSFCLPAQASRTITDQLDRTVTIPDQVSRAVVLQHQTLNITNQLDAMGQIVGVLSDWKKQLGEDYLRLAPSLKDMATPGDLTSVNMESLLKLKPDVVFVTNYAPAEMIKQISDANIPVIGISLRTGSKKELEKLNPTVSDAYEAYSQGLKQGIELIAYVFNKEENGKELIKAAFQYQKLLKDRVGGIELKDRPKCYVTNPDLVTYGSGKFTGVFLETSGAYNVAAPFIKGYKKVSIEEVLKWNPQNILVQNRYPGVIKQIKSSPEWKNIQAVKGGRLYCMPQFAKLWGYPQPEAMAIGEIWLAKKLYPAKFSDIDVEKAVQNYYQKFYRVPYIPSDPAK